MIPVWIGARTAAGGYGGWANLRLAAEPQGTAGGDRRTTPMRMLLTAALDALEADEATPVRLTCADPAFLAAARSLAAWRAAGWKTEAGEPVPEADLWAKLVEALQARPGSGFADARKTAAALEFVDAWAGFALDIAKTKGQFSSAIPKPNLKAVAAKL